MMREQKNRILQVVLVLLSIWMIAGISVFAKVEKLNINQMAQEGNNVYIYTDVLDMQGNVISASSLSAKEFAIELDGRSTLEVKDVAIAKKTEGMSYVFCIDISRSVTDSEMQNIKSIMGIFLDPSFVLSFHSADENDRHSTCFANHLNNFPSNIPKA